MAPLWARFLWCPAVRHTVTLAVACFAATAPAFAQGPAHAGPQSQVEVEGLLEHLHQDWPTGSRNLYFLESTAGERLSLHFSADPLKHLLTGTRIRVRGVRVGQTLE